MPNIVSIREVIDGYFGDNDCKHAEDYMLFRAMEDWCYDNIPRDRWRLDFAHTICVCGVDIPGRIFFWEDEDLTAFRLRFKC